MDLLDELQTQVLCGDGAIGTLLLEQGIPLERCFEELCVIEPERIEKIHLDYVGAGARVIKTNTFGGNAVRLARFGFEKRVGEINGAAARIAQRPAQGKAIYVAGSVGPLGLTADEARDRGIDRRDCFREQIGALLEGGVDLIFFETFTDVGEMEIAFQARREIDDGLAICSFACSPDGRLAAGTLLVDGFAKLRELNAQMVGVNCVSPEEIVQLIPPGPGDYLLSAYPNAGYPTSHEGRLLYPSRPEDLAKVARRLIAGGARLVGGCCGTTPKHIASIAAEIAGMQEK